MKYYTDMDFSGAINASAHDEIINIARYTPDDERLCELLDAANWAEKTGTGEYRIADAEKMADLLEWIALYTDGSCEHWNIDGFASDVETVVELDGDIVFQAGIGAPDYFAPAGMWDCVECNLNAVDPDGNDEHNIVVERGFTKFWYTANFNGKIWDILER